MSAAVTLRAELASGVRLTVDGEILVLDTCARRALIVRDGES
jgi:hypothetical protein